MKFVISNNWNIIGFNNGKPFMISPEDKNYKEIKEALLSSKDISQYLLDDINLQTKTNGILSTKYRIPSWDGVPLPEYLSNKIMDIVSKGYEFDPIIKFMYNLVMNPKEHSIAELIDFLRNKNLPLTEDGQFLGYKGVRNDYKDIYSGTITNYVGSSPKVDIKDVDPNRYIECSRGLHVGAIDYVKYYTSNHNDSRFVIVKVNPKNVITVPIDHNFQKLRCCEYNVVAEMSKDFVLSDRIYNEEVLTKEISEHKLKIEQIDFKPGWRSFIKDRFSDVINYLKGKR